MRRNLSSSAALKPLAKTIAERTGLDSSFSSIPVTCAAGDRDHRDAGFGWQFGHAAQRGEAVGLPGLRLHGSTALR